MQGRRDICSFLVMCELTQIISFVFYSDYIITKSVVNVYDAALSINPDSVVKPPVQACGFFHLTTDQLDYIIQQCAVIVFTPTRLSGTPYWRGRCHQLQDYCPLLGPLCQYS